MCVEFIFGLNVSRISERICFQIGSVHWFNQMTNNFTIYIWFDSIQSNSIHQIAHNDPQIIQTELMPSNAGDFYNIVGKPSKSMHKYAHELQIILIFIVDFIQFATNSSKLSVHFFNNFFSTPPGNFYC